MSAARSRPMPAEVEPLWTTADVMRWLGCSADTVHRNQAALGALKIGRSVRFRREDVEAYIECQRVQPAQPAVPMQIEAARTRQVLKHRNKIGSVTGRRYA